MTEHIKLVREGERDLAGWTNVSDKYRLNNILYTDQLPRDHRKNPQSSLTQAPFYTFGDALVKQLDESISNGWKFTDEAYEKSEDLTQTLYDLKDQFNKSGGLQDPKRLIIIDITDKYDSRKKLYSISRINEVVNVGEGWEIPLFEAEEYYTQFFESQLAKFASLNQMCHLEK